MFSMTDSINKLSRLLLLRRPDELAAALEHLQELTGKSNIAERVWNENEERFEKKLGLLKVKSGATPQQQYEVLLAQVGRAEQELSVVAKRYGFDRLGTEQAMEQLLSFGAKISPYLRGFFLKASVARAYLRRYPPVGQVEHLGYRNVDELLEREDIFELFAALRFSESKAWADKFIAGYADLRPDDFEHRRIRMLTINPKKWRALAAPFVKKKYHNLSHSKEMGIVFAIPLPSRADGMRLRALALLEHYFAEVNFYATLFEIQAKSPKNHFGRGVVVAILGDLDHKLRQTKKSFCWPILQRYVAKDPRQDWRFFAPHVMPEAVHWRRGLSAIAKFAKRRRLTNLSFWEEDFDWVGKRTDGAHSVLTLNAEDLIFSYAKDLSFGKHYFYHWRESLWNKIFSEAVGEEHMIELMAANLSKGQVCELS